MDISNREESNRINSQLLYTSSPAKMLKHSDRIKEIQSGIFRPISLQFAITDVCNLGCEFCCNANREGNELTFEEVRDILTVFKRMGALSVEFTGGEPTLHPQINEILRFAHLLGYSVGMKTNGVEFISKISPDVIPYMTWVRVSLNSLDYVSSIDLTGVSDKTTLGLSYVMQIDSPTTIFPVLKEYKERYQAEYIRVIPDNTLSDVQLEELYLRAGKDKIFDDPHCFWQIKDYSIPKYCWMMWLKPFINTDRNIYFCCATQMFEHKFIPKYKLCSTNPEDISNTWKKARRFDGSICKGGICYFKQHNDLIEFITEDIQHRDFI